MDQLKPIDQELADEEDYNEEEDEDFDPTKAGDELLGGDDNEGEDEEDDVDKKVQKQYKLMESASGGLIKTRRARLVEEEEARKNKYGSMERSEPVSAVVNDLWSELKQSSIDRLNNRGSYNSVMNENKEVETKDDQDKMGVELIWIERSYKFANETYHEKKQVPKNSAEAQEYLNNLKFKESKVEHSDNEIKSKPETLANDSKHKLRRPLKRPPMLEQIISGALKPKLTTLEKSKMDWARYVDEEGINDELMSHNKDGFLAKQDFLSQVEHHKDRQYKEFRQKEMALRFQEQNQNRT